MVISTLLHHNNIMIYNVYMGGQMSQNATKHSVSIQFTKSDSYLVNQTPIYILNRTPI